MALLKGRDMVYNGFKSGIFLLPSQPVVLVKPEKSSSSGPNLMRKIKLSL